MYVNLILVTYKLLVMAMGLLYCWMYSVLPENVVRVVDLVFIQGTQGMCQIPAVNGK